VEDAYLHLHDLDWLQTSEISRIPEVQAHLNRQQTMSQGQALRILLFDSARHLIRDLATVPDKSGVKTFLDGYLAGKTITSIAREIGVRREWVSRAYRREGLDLAVAHFIRVMSPETKE